MLLTLTACRATDGTDRLATDNETLETVKKDKETVHLNHCVDVLLQTLQCSGNMAMHAVHWVETEEWPWPDM